MHPLALWLINSSQFRERDDDDRMLRRQREARGRDFDVARDGRWAAAMRRWSEEDAAAAAAPATRVATSAPATVECATA
ncbi:hypothetical protein ACPPVQ_14675 [Diaminobutyricibacter sp. McL0618]|uniref:hypothetical protein n=1 Tax=Leifsonia sp. McL0618 TaxID=3415677 RepID=UPI003CFB378A